MASINKRALLAFHQHQVLLSARLNLSVSMRSFLLSSVSLVSLLPPIRRVVSR